MVMCIGDYEKRWLSESRLIILTGPQVQWLQFHYSLGWQGGARAHNFVSWAIASPHHLHIMNPRVFLYPSSCSWRSCVKFVIPVVVGSNFTIKGFRGFPLGLGFPRKNIVYCASCYFLEILMIWCYDWWL